MKLKFEAQKPGRVKHKFMGITTFENSWWFNYKTKKWQPNSNPFCNTHQPCQTVRAFRRKLKKAPKGVNFILVSRWIDSDVHGVGSTPII